jgi:hypothetical protein
LVRAWKEDSVASITVAVESCREEHALDILFMKSTTHYWRSQKYFLQHTGSGTLLAQDCYTWQTRSFIRMLLHPVLFDAHTMVVTDCTCDSRRRGCVGQTAVQYPSLHGCLSDSDDRRHIDHTPRNSQSAIMVWESLFEQGCIQ